MEPRKNAILSVSAGGMAGEAIFAEAITSVGGWYFSIFSTCLLWCWRVVYGTMLIWLTVLVLVLLFAALGFAKGAIRMFFPLIGLFVGIALALPLSPLVRPLVPMVGLENPIWSILLPPVIVFFLVSLIMVGIGFVVHWKLNLYYKYRTDDNQYQRWLRLNQRAGISMGLVAGVVYSLLIGVVVYSLGYLTVQVSAGDSDPAVIRYLNQARGDLHSSGLESAVASFSPTPQIYYSAADVLGLLYHNPLLHTRLATYPPFLALAERPELQDIANDSAYQNMLATQASVSQIIQDPKTQGLINNEGLKAELKQIDLKDLYHYLKTGESDLYSDRPVLGRWEVDPFASMLQEKRRRVSLTVGDMLKLREQMKLLGSMRLIFTPDNVVRLKGPDVAALMQRVEEVGIQRRRTVPVVRVPVATASPTGGSGPSAAEQARFMERYGTRPASPTPTAPAPAPVRAPTAATPAPLSPSAIEEELARTPSVLLAEGTWREDRGRYLVTLRPSKEFYFFEGRQAPELQGTIRDGSLYLTKERKSLVLERF